MVTLPDSPSRGHLLRSEDAKESTMLDIRHLGAVPNDIENAFDATALVRTGSPGSDARFGLRAILPQAPVARRVISIGGQFGDGDDFVPQKGEEPNARSQASLDRSEVAHCSRSQDPRRLEQELKACRRKIAHEGERLAEVSGMEAAGVVRCKHPAVGRRVLMQSCEQRVEAS
jgi:hypothetical protein